jgi:hypothetical protein
MWFIPVIGAILGLAFVGFALFIRHKQYVPAYSATDTRTNESRSDLALALLFAIWTLLPPSLWFIQWLVHGLPPNLPEVTFERKVISDLWAAIAVVLGLLFGIGKKKEP